MARTFIRLAILSILASVLLIAGRLPAHSDSSSTGSKPVFDATYRSRSSSHKVIVYPDDAALREQVLNDGGELLEDYGAYALMRAPAQTAERVSLQSRAGSGVRDDMNMVLLRARQFDTTEGEPPATASFGVTEAADQQLYLVQMIGPVKSEWRQALDADGSDVIAYIPNNAYLVRATAGGMERINRLKQNDRSFIQWTGAYRPEYKIAPELRLDADQDVVVTIELVGAEANSDVLERVLARGQAVRVGPKASLSGVTDVRVRMNARKIADLARMPNVMWIEPWQAPAMLDERQDQIVAGNYNGNVISSPRYLEWLQSKGLASTPSFVVDIADSGLDKGILDPLVIHKDFLNPAGINRVLYSRPVSADDLVFSSEDLSGHGTLNASIVGGYNNDSVFPFVDPSGYRFGLGVHPFAKLGATRIFAPDYTNPDLSQMLTMMYRDGTRVSSNSWGAYNNAYTSECKFYDAFVRDSQFLTEGRQEMNIVFSSGNRGPGGNLSVPGHAKNVITVGATEGIRPGMDGCDIGTSGADEIESVASFSSSGPSNDGRTKPDILAPGSHIQGAQSQAPFYNGAGICGPVNFPAGQTLYTWSSGTSHAAPAVAGAAALVRQYVEQTTGRVPSPAMVKALLLNSTTFVSGSGGGGNLPGPEQGWGLMNLGKTLDSIARVRVDQEVVFNTSGAAFEVKAAVASGGAPVRITLVWTDAPGNPPAFGPSVNNLDLRVEINGKIYLGNNFDGSTSVEGGTQDTKNNVESVWLPVGTEGQFTVRVIATSITGDGVPHNGPVTTDQDFALVIYNAQLPTGGGGGGPSDPLDSPPAVDLLFPEGGEHVLVGDLMRIRWASSDDKGIQSQKIEFSADGVNFATIGIVDGTTQQFDWRVPSLPTPFGKIRITALDGVNLPVAAANELPFSIEQGPPDLIPPTVLLQSPVSDQIIGGGQVLKIKWNEADNVGVLHRLIEWSTNGGQTFDTIVALDAPSSGSQQTYDWEVPGEMDTQKGKVRITVSDGAGNSATITSPGRFEVRPMPVVTEVDYHVGVDGAKDELEVAGRNFRIEDTKIIIDDKELGKIKFKERFETGNGTCRKVFSIDKKLNKRVPIKQTVNVFVRIKFTNQISAPFAYRRPRNP
jgi:hypothetical protein